MFDRKAAEAALKESWSRDSGSLWSPQNPARGQCGVTALVIHDAFGGEILKTLLPDGLWHFYNRLDGRRCDFTAGQFNEPPAYSDVSSGSDEVFRDTDRRQYEALSRLLAAAYRRRTETLDEKLQRVLSEDVVIVPYDPRWPEMFAEERRHLSGCLPEDLVVRIEHFGSTAVPGMCAKPVIDMLVEVTSLEETKRRIVPVLESQRYDYFWRPTRGDDVPPFYAWFIRRDAAGRRTHHIHMVGKEFEHWERLRFRDYLIGHPAAAAEYGNLKRELAARYPGDRAAYTEGKTEFIKRITRAAHEYQRQICSHESDRT